MAFCPCYTLRCDRLCRVIAGIVFFTVQRQGTCLMLFPRTSWNRAVGSSMKSSADNSWGLHTAEASFGSLHVGVCAHAWVMWKNYFSSGLSREKLPSLHCTSIISAQAFFDHGGYCEFVYTAFLAHCQVPKVCDAAKLSAGHLECLHGMVTRDRGHCHAHGQGLQFMWKTLFAYERIYFTPGIFFMNFEENVERILISNISCALYVLK